MLSDFKKAVTREDHSDLESGSLLMRDDGKVLLPWANMFIATIRWPG